MTFSAAAAISPSSAATCPHCAGAGYYKEEVPYGHPNFGKLMPCICKQQEMGQRAAEKLYEISNLGPFNDKTFENFNPAVPGVQGAFYAAQKYAERPQGWMVIFGNYGAGKTHLAAATANELLNNHYRVLFAVVPDLLDHLRATFGPSSEVEYDERFEAIRDVQVLVLDDLAPKIPRPGHAKSCSRSSTIAIITRSRLCSPATASPKISTRACFRACRIARCATSTS